MTDPFKLFGRMLVATVVVTGYFLVFLAQTIWFLVFGKPDRIGEAFGYLGRKASDEFGNLFR